MGETGSVQAVNEAGSMADAPEQHTGNGSVGFGELPDEIRQVLEGGSPEGELSLDDIFELLKNRRRRDVIAFLRGDADGNATLGELAEHIAAKENDIEVRELSSDQRKRVYIGLYQCHLPKMDDMGIIDFESNRGQIELLPSVDQLEPYLEQSRDGHIEPKPWFELGVTAVVLVALVTGFAGVGPFSGVSPVVWAGVSTAALIVVSLYQILRPR